MRTKRALAFGLVTFTMAFSGLAGDSAADPYLGDWKTEGKSRSGGLVAQVIPRANGEYLINMCAPPLQWQSYDIEYHAPRFDAQGGLRAPARITVDHNGKLIHKAQDLPFNEQAMKTRREKPETRQPGRIKLQDHGYPVRFRNIWLVELGDARPAGK